MMSDQTQPQPPVSEGARDFFNLIVLPIGPDPDIVEPHLETLESITELDRFTLRQKFIGSSVTVLARDTDRERIEKLASALEGARYPAVAVADSTFYATEAAARAVSVIMENGAISFLNSRDEVVGRIERGDEVEMVLGDLKPRRGGGAIAMAAGRTRAQDPEKAVDAISRGVPVADICTAGMNRPVRIFGSSFNYRSLGESATLSRVKNFLFIIDWVKAAAGKIRIDVDFFEGGGHRIKIRESLDHPVDLEPAEKSAFHSFERYSRLVITASRAGLYRDEEEVRKRHRTFAEALSGASAQAAAGGRQAPPPPTAAPLPAGSPWKSRFNRGGEWFRSLGPPILFAPLVAASAASALCAFTLETWSALLPAGLFSGIGFFVHGLAIISRYRRIENIPTARIRSIAMGLVEVSGEARQKYLLKTPYSLLDCVFYRYKVVEQYETHKGRAQRILASGDSGWMPFYLEDESDHILVEPEGAVIEGLITQTFHPGTTSTAGPWATSDSASLNITIVETLIPVGYSIYALGTAQRRTCAFSRRREELLERLRELKSSPDRLSAYDLNGDGKVDIEEWQQARQDVEHQLMEESLHETEDPDDVFIGKGEQGQPFLISSKSEKALVRRLRTRAVLCIASGVLAAVVSLYFMVRILPGLFA